MAATIRNMVTPVREMTAAIRDTAAGAGRAVSAQKRAGRARLALFATFAALVGIGFAPLRPNPAAAVEAAAVAVAAGALLIWRRRPLLLYAAIATAGIAVLSYGESYHVGWFAVCLIAVWCGFAGQRRDAALFLAGAVALFAAQWGWVHPDSGWAGWIGGTVLSTACGMLVRQQSELVAQLREAQAGLAERARAEERNRIGRELHDVIAHTLTVALLHVTSARLAVEHDPDDAARSLAEAERLSRESLDEVRLAVGMLHSGGDAAGTAPLPGVDGLQSLAERFRSAGADVTLTVDGDTSRLHAATGLTVYRITQEALTNAARHAPGAPVAVRLAVGPAAVRLTVDNAPAPSSTAPSSTGAQRAEPVPRAGSGLGLGLISMRERAESVGGSCQAGPGGSGWLVEATLPLSVSGRLAGAA
jgi:signal transduction histidine kinase